MKKIIQFVLISIIIGSGSVAAQQEITFKLAALPGTKSVYVVGDFNNWSKTANPMVDPDQDGVWEITMSLQPGRYEYRFFIDEMLWVKDPMCPDWGGEYSNSIIWVKHPRQPELKHLRPEIGTSLRSSDVMINALFVDGVEKHGLSINHTQVLLNGQSQKFSFDQKSNNIECFLTRMQDGEYQVNIETGDRMGNNATPLTGFFLVNHSNTPPVLDAGYTIIAAVNSTVRLASGCYYDPDRDPIQHYQWKLVSRPEGSKAKLNYADMAFPEFKPDKAGRYLFTLQVSEGSAESHCDSIDVYALVKHDYPIEFSLSDSVFTANYETPITSVAVAGEFNNWSTTDNPMNDYNHDGIWTAWVNLDPGEYEYKFVVNGQHWITDPNNPKRVPDGWNGFNSIVTTALDLTPVINCHANLGPGKILFDASASSSKSGRNLTFAWYQDINNRQRFDLPSSEKVSFPIPKQAGTYYFYLVVSDLFGASSQKTMVVSVDHGAIKIRDFSHSPDWAKDAIVYEIFVRQFTPEGNFKGLMEKIPYLKSLGINCIWLMPIWDGPTAHGYGPTNFFAIEQDYGTINDFKELITDAHQAGIRVILDFIANHTSDQHVYFISAYHNPGSSFRDWYLWHDPNNRQSYYSYKFHNDWDTLPNLNYENPNVRKYIMEVAEYWAGLGVDGFRCDVAWGVPHDFWKLFRRTLKNMNADFLIINEVLPRSPSYHKDEFDMSYDTDFYGNLLDVMNGRKPLSALDYGLKKTIKNYPEFTLDFRYLENHDLDRFIKQFGLAKTKLAATLLLTMPGTPLIYYGQEVGLTEKNPPMDWDRQNDPLLEFYRKLILLRRNHACIRRGDMIKVATNAEQSVYAYLRKGSNETFLIVLNFGARRDDCQLLFAESPFENIKNKKIMLENIITSEPQLVHLLHSRQIQLKLEAATPYIFKLIQ